MKQELSSRELAVLSLAVQGYTDDMIAHELTIEKGTVNSYWVRIRSKLGNYSRTELVARFVQKNADDALVEHNMRNEASADALAVENKLVLEKANAEIARLQDLLKEKRKS